MREPSVFVASFLIPGAGGRATGSPPCDECLVWFDQLVGAPLPVTASRP